MLFRSPRRRTKHHRLPFHRKLLHPLVKLSQIAPYQRLPNHKHRQDSRSAQKHLRNRHSQALEQARGALLKRHAALINETLSRLRADRATAGSNTGEFNEMVSKLSALRDRQTVLTYLCAAILLAFNWYIYILSLIHI